MKWKEVPSSQTQEVIWVEFVIVPDLEGDDRWQFLFRLIQFPEVFLLFNH